MLGSGVVVVVVVESEVEKGGKWKRKHNKQC